MSPGGRPPDEARDGPPAIPALGRRLGRYELFHELGRGGMATVRLARVRGPGGFLKWVAVKTIRPALVHDRRFLDMFLDEARIAAGLQHPNVCQVHDLGEERGEYYIAMEYLHGEHLGELSAAAARRLGGLPVALAAHVVAQVARGLHHAHEAKDAKGAPLSLVHRDVSPKNVFVTYEGAVKITDFGVAKAAGRLTATEAGGVKGKWSYMSPEQVQGEPVDRRSDVFSLGTVLWELTTGERLFVAESELRVVMRISSGSVPPPSTVVPGYDPALERIVMRALARSPADRHPTAAALADDLEAFVAGSAGPQSTTRLAELMSQLFGERIRARDSDLEAIADRSLVPSAGEALVPGSEGLPTAGDALDPSSEGFVTIADRPPVMEPASDEEATVPVAPARPGPEAETVAIGPPAQGSVVAAPRGAAAGAGPALRAGPGGERPRWRVPFWLVLAAATLLTSGAGSLAVLLVFRPSAPAAQVDSVSAPTSGLAPTPTPAPPAATEGPAPAPEPGAPGELVSPASGPTAAAPRADAPSRPIGAPLRPDAPATARPARAQAAGGARTGEGAEASSPGEESGAGAAPRPREPAYLNLLADPWALVWIDGRPAGQTPLIRREVRSGTLTVVLVREGDGARRTLTLEVAPGETVSRRVTFD